MNERIRELADKAAENISSSPWNSSDDFSGKFAQLIIQECIEVACPKLTDIVVKKRLKQYFGVEE
tara:strand:+ start:509 stop:703 length:195 start_codon:yes stop_codon:yes gene_type:complete